MKLNELVLDRLGEILQKYNLKIVEQFDDYIKFKSKHVVITIFRDEKENIYQSFIGKSENTQFLLDGNIVKEFFIPNLEEQFIIPEVSQEEFVNNLQTLLEGSGRVLLEGDMRTFIRIENYVNQSAQNFTQSLVEKQIIEAANLAWSRNDYKTFIECLDKVKKEKLPASYLLKYRYAMKKVANG